MKKSAIYHIFLILVGIVLGTLIAKVTAGVPALGWLSYALTFGFESPLVLNLAVIRLTLGVSIDLSVAVILFVTLSLVLGRYFAR
ncbi:MAG: DUF4321 domain-containing protein [Clostridia bacterium]|nr:DUF4321 domain-containing protein [Clostridia bacterium]